MEYFYYKIGDVEGLVMAETLPRAAERLTEFYGEYVSVSQVEPINEADWGGWIALEKASDSLGFVHC